MQKLGNRIAVIFFSSIAAVQEGISARIIAGILLAFIVSCVGMYTSKKWFIWLAGTGYAVLSLASPVLLLVYPVILYEMLSLLREDTLRPWTVGTLLLMAVWTVLHRGNFSISVMVGEIGIAGLAVWLERNCHQFENLLESYIRTQDNSTEITLELKNENKYLLEKQDSEIYTATLKERNRIAREIHDNVGHMLSRAILMTGAMLTVAKEGPVRDGLVGLKECLDEAMTNIRESVHNLYDESIDMEQAARNLMKDMGNYKINMEYDMSKTVPREVKYCLISILKESLSNVMKHSNGNQIWISMIEHPGFYKLAVIDNGCCEERKGQVGGIGLHNIKDRVDSLFGTLNITAEKTGFKVYVSIPKQKCE